VARAEGTRELPALALGASALGPPTGRAYACGRAPGPTHGRHAGARRARGLRFRFAGSGAHEARPAALLRRPRDPWLAARPRPAGLRAGGLLLRPQRADRPGQRAHSASHAGRGVRVQRVAPLSRGPDPAAGRRGARARDLPPAGRTGRRLQRPREGALHDPERQVHRVAAAAEHQARARSSSIRCRSARRLSRRSCASRSRRCSSPVTADIGGTSVGLPSSSRATIVR
jgi:hypothetical protein